MRKVLIVNQSNKGQKVQVMLTTQGPAKGPWLWELKPRESVEVKIPKKAVLFVEAPDDYPMDDK